MRDPRAQPFASLFNLDRPGLFQLTESTLPCVFDQSSGPQPWAPKYDGVLSALFEHESIKLDQHHPGRAADPVPEKLKGAVMRDTGKRLDRPLPANRRGQIGAQPI